MERGLEMNKPEKDFLHTEAFEWVNSTKKEEKQEEPFTSLTINQNLGVTGYVTITCIVLMTLITSIMGLVTIFGQLGVI